MVCSLMLSVNVTTLPVLTSPLSLTMPVPEIATDATVGGVLIIGSIELENALVLPEVSVAAVVNV